MRIGEAKQRDVGKKRARIGPDAMDFLKVSPGDIVEVMGSRSSCAVVSGQLMKMKNYQIS